MAPCRSEFIREAWVWLINPYRTHCRFANKSAPTGGARPCGLRRFSDRSHAPRGNAAQDAPRPPLVTQSVTGCIPTRSVGPIKYLPCRSEFIREAWVWLINPHRTHRRFANKFAPTGGACPLRLTQVFRSFPRSASALTDAERHRLHSHAERGNDQHADSGLINRRHVSAKKTGLIVISGPFVFCVTTCGRELARDGAE